MLFEAFIVLLAGFPIISMKTHGRIRPHGRLLRSRFLAEMNRPVKREGTIYRHNRTLKADLVIGPDYPKASWPTPLALIAWKTSDHYQKEQDLAIKFVTTQVNFLGSIAILVEEEYHSS